MFQGVTEALFNGDYIPLLVLVLGYALTFLTSGMAVRMIVRSGGKTEKRHASQRDAAEKERQDLGAIIGKCENFLAVTFILANEATGLAVIFAVKSMVRAEDMKRDPRYFLGGTLVNFSYSVLMAYLIRSVLGELVAAAPGGSSIIQNIFG